MWKQSARRCRRAAILSVLGRNYAAVRVPVPAPAPAAEVLRVTRNHIAYVDAAALKEAPKPRQLLSLPSFPSRPLHPPASSSSGGRVTAVSWIKYYFHHRNHYPVIQSLFTKGLVLMERPKKLREGSSSPSGGGSGCPCPATIAVKIKPNEVMQPGDRVYLPVSVAESRISRRYDTIPTGTLYPNADEIAYLRRLVIYKDSSIIVLNKPPRLPVKGNLPVHNSLDALAAAALSYDYDEGPKLGQSIWC